MKPKNHLNLITKISINEEYANNDIMKHEMKKLNNFQKVLKNKSKINWIIQVYCTEFKLFSLLNSFKYNTEMTYEGIFFSDEKKDIVYFLDLIKFQV